MSVVRRWALLAAMAVVASSPVMAAYAQPVEQSVVLDRSSAAVGAQVAVDLAGWQVGVAQVELCGNSAARGTVDCDPLTTIAVAVGTDGRAQTLLTVSAPPVPCPCVIRVSQATTGAVAALPFTVSSPYTVSGSTSVGTTESAQTPTAPPARVRAVDVVSVQVVNDEGPAAPFAVDAARRVVVMVRNSGTVVVTGVTASARLVGFGASSRPMPSPPAFDLAPGATARIVMAIDLPTPAFGDYRIVGQIDGGDEPTPFSARSTHIPWGVISAAVLGVAVWLSRHVPVRRRSRWMSRGRRRQQLGTA